MGYYIDLEKISIDNYKNILKNTHLIPSWKILENEIDANLNLIKKQKVGNLAELQLALKTKDKVQEFANQSGLPEEYLAVLRRVVNGYQPKPNRFKDIPEISKKVVEQLEAVGIKNTLHLYENVLTAKKRSKFAETSRINENEILRLAMLTDLSRVRWVNHTFAYVLLEAGYKSAEMVANADYNEMYTRITELNKLRQIYKGNIGANDMKMCVEAAKGLTFEMEF